MDSHHKRKGFIKGKLLPFSRASSKIPSSVQQISRTRPNQSSASAGSITYLVDHQEVQPQPRQKYSFLIPDYGYRCPNEFDSYFSTVADENVNMKAAVYISSVKERFKLEGINS